MKNSLFPGADLEGAGEDALYLKDSTPCQTKGSHFYTLLRYPFLMSDTKNFKGTFCANVY